MIHAEFLRILRCPVTGEPLELAPEDLLQWLNRNIAARRISNRIGTVCVQRLAAAVVNRSHTILYPIVDNTPWLLPNEGIAIDKRATGDE